MVRFVLHSANVILLIGMTVCLAGAMAGLILFLPFVGGAWGLNLVALLGREKAG
jgi:hypothetical protein